MGSNAPPPASPAPTLTPTTVTPRPPTQPPTPAPFPPGRRRTQTLTISLVPDPDGLGAADQLWGFLPRDNPALFYGFFVLCALALLLLLFGLYKLWRSRQEAMRERTKSVKQSNDQELQQKLMLNDPNANRNNKQFVPEIDFFPDPPPPIGTPQYAAWLDKHARDFLPETFGGSAPPPFGTAAYEEWKKRNNKKFTPRLFSYDPPPPLNHQDFDKWVSRNNTCFFPEFAGQDPMPNIVSPLFHKWVERNNRKYTYLPDGPGGAAVPPSSLLGTTTAEASSLSPLATFSAFKELPGPKEVTKEGPKGKLVPLEVEKKSSKRCPTCHQLLPDESVKVGGTKLLRKELEFMMQEGRAVEERPPDVDDEADL